MSGLDGLPDIRSQYVKFPISVNQAQRRSEQGSSRRGKPELLLYFPPFAVESMFAFIDNVAERRKKKRER